MDITREIHHCLILVNLEGWGEYYHKGVHEEVRGHSHLFIVPSAGTQRGVDGVWGHRARDKTAAQSPGWRKPASVLAPSNSFAPLSVFSGCYALKYLNEHIRTDGKYKSFDVNCVLLENKIVSQSGEHFLLFVPGLGNWGVHTTLRVPKGIAWAVYLDFDTLAHILRVYK